MTCDNCKCYEDPMGICQHARAKLDKRLKKVDVKILREEGVSEHDLSDEEFEKIIKDAYNRFKPTMERLK